MMNEIKMFFSPQVCPGHRLPPGLLLAGKGGLTTELERFSNAKTVDMMNEKRPELPDDAKEAPPA